MTSVAGRLSDAIVFLTTSTFIKRIGNCPLGPIAQGRPATDWTEPGSPVMSRPTQGGLKRLSQTGRGFAELQHAPRLGPNGYFKFGLIFALRSPRSDPFDGIDSSTCHWQRINVAHP